MLSREELISRAAIRSESPGDYWCKFAEMLTARKSLERSEFSQKQWNWYQMAKADLTEAWE